MYGSDAAATCERDSLLPPPLPAALLTMPACLARLALLMPPVGNGAKRGVACAATGPTANCHDCSASSLPAPANSASRATSLFSSPCLLSTLAAVMRTV